MPSPSTIVRSADPALRSALRLASLFALAKLLLQFALTLWTLHLGYGYFRDEFYYLACGHHLAWGFVDHGPIVALQARLGELLFGDSVFGIRVLSAVAGAITVGLGGVLTWALGGRRSAQVLAMFGLLICPQYIGIDGYLSMNSYEPVFWMLCVLAVCRLLAGASAAKWWTIFGVSAGVGLLNKPSMTFFLIAVGIGLVATPTRRILFSRWAAMGILLMLLLALPNVLWQMHHHWPTLEFLENGRRGGKNVVLDPLQFFLAQFAMLHPINALLWITGVVALLRQRSIREGRWLGIAYIVFYVVMDASHAKDYYLEGIYPALFAAGAIAWEHHAARSARVLQQRIIAFPLLETLMLITGLLVLPMASPVLPPATWVRYTTALHLRPGQQETASTGPLPQFYADRFGWNEQVALVLQAYRTLSPEEQRRVCIFGSNYGEAGAIDLLGHQQMPTLPPAISGQNSYWMWGMHGCDTNVAIAIVGDTRAELEQKYQSVTLIGQPVAQYAMPFEQRHGVWLLKGRRASPPFHWEDERFYY
jgi:4-amino-4-deoxy-L-arabinose transferase-like glycosyltransferase